MAVNTTVAHRTYVHHTYIILYFFYSGTVPPVPEYPEYIFIILYCVMCHDVSFSNFSLFVRSFVHITFIHNLHIHIVHIHIQHSSLISPVALHLPNGIPGPVAAAAVPAGDPLLAERAHGKNPPVCVPGVEPEAGSAAFRAIPGHRHFGPLVRGAVRLRQVHFAA